MCPYCSAPVGRSIQIDRNRLGDIPHPHLTRWAFGFVVLIEIVQTLGFFLWISGATSRSGESGDWHQMFTLALLPWLLARVAWVIVSLTLMGGRLTFPPALVGCGINSAIVLFVVLSQLSSDSSSTLSRVLGATFLVVPWLWILTTIVDCTIGQCVARASGTKSVVPAVFGTLAILVPMIGLALLLLASTTSAGFAFGGWILYVMGVAAASGPLSLVRSIWVWRSLRGWHRTN